MNTTRLPLNIVIAQFTPTAFIALCDIGGATIRSNRRAKDAISAVQDLFSLLAEPNGEASIGLDLALAGVTMTDLAALGDGTDGGTPNA